MNNPSPSNPRQSVADLLSQTMAQVAALEQFLQSMAHLEKGHRQLDQVIRDHFELKALDESNFTAYLQLRRLRKAERLLDLREAAAQRRAAAAPQKPATRN